MRATIFSLLAAATLAAAQSTDAPVVLNNPIGATYIAKLPTKEGSELQGSIVAVSHPTGNGVNLAVSITGLPKEGGPFMYHIHAKPVPEDGNCTATGAHLDPYNRGEKPLCDAARQQTCQTGDLSGKHGNITDQQISISYHDSYLALLPSDPSFFGNLSFVVHLSNKTRIGCANFVEQSGGVTLSASSSSTAEPASSGTALPSGAPTGLNSTSIVSSTTASETRGPTGTPIPPTTTSTTNLPTGGAQKLAAGAGALVAGVAAILL